MATMTRLLKIGAWVLALIVVAGVLSIGSSVASTQPVSAQGVPQGAPSSARAGSGATNMYAERSAPLPQSDNPGRDLYQQTCATCHGTVGQGTPESPPLIGVGAAAVDFYISTGRMPVDHIQAQSPRGIPRLNDEQRRAIVEYVAGLSEGPSIPVVDSTKGDLAQGNRLYTNHCAACHNSQGSGGALLKGSYAPSLFPSTALQVAEAIRVGPGAMPKYGPETFSDQEVNSLVRYVEHLQHPKGEGGLQLGRLGPVAEGFIVWFLVLGGLLAVTRWIGTRV